ncbi:uncharacterized protein B4U80_00566 [Leptotrombidium deliense]|uniref:Uncharacterized protein n=1 Tax=Leptotrombidium deliense TaxID=299467 RepID=A0A443RV81_9ACAR|nr:uncharacterized protein B4U80_00566 [Leptotrombidium deliense]
MASFVINAAEKTIDYEAALDSLPREIVNDPILNKYKQCFEGIGCLKTIHKIKLKDEAIPRIVARRIPVALRDKVKSALDDLEAKGIIEKVNEAT